MSKEKFYRLYQCLNTNEQKSFRHFIDYRHPNNTLGKKQFIEILDLVDDAGRKIIGDEAISGLLNYPITQYRVIKSRLLKLILDFLACEHLGNAREEMYGIALEALRKRQFPIVSDYSNFHLQAEKSLIKFQGHSAHKRMLQYQFDTKLCEYLIGMKPRETDNKLITCFRRLESFALLERLRVGAALLNQDFILYTSDAPRDQLRTFAQGVRDGRSDLELVDRLYLLVIEAYLYRELRDFKFSELKNHLSASLAKKELTSIDIGDLYQYLLNYNAHRINQGEVGAIRESFETYQPLLKGGHLLRNGKMPKLIFRNIMQLALNLEEVAWADEFVKTYKERIADDWDGSARDFWEGATAHFKGYFDESERLFLKVQGFTEDPFFACHSRMYLLMSYYERKKAPFPMGGDSGSEVDHLTQRQKNLIRSFDKYLKENRKIATRLQENFRNFIRFYKILQGLGRAGVAKQLGALADTPNVAVRKWLEKQMSEIEGAN